MEYFEHAGRVYECTTFAPSFGDGVMFELWDVGSGGKLIAEARLAQDGLALHGDNIPLMVFRWWWDVITAVAGSQAQRDQDGAVDDE